jgi:hypothetical protein
VNDGAPWYLLLEYTLKLLAVVRRENDHNGVVFGNIHIFVHLVWKRDEHVAVLHRISCGVQPHIHGAGQDNHDFDMMVKMRTTANAVRPR